MGVWWGCAGGRYSEGNLKKSMTMLNGAPHAVMLKADFDQAVKSPQHVTGDAILRLEFTA